MLGTKFKSLKDSFRRCEFCRLSKVGRQIYYVGDRRICRDCIETRNKQESLLDKLRRERIYYND